MFKSMTLGVKIAMGFTAVALLALALGLFGFYGAVKNDRSINEIGLVRLPSVESLLVISEAQTAVDSAENALLSTHLDNETRQAQYKRFADAEKRADDAWKIYEPLPQSAEEAVTWNKFVPAWDKWWKDHEDYTKLSHDFDAVGIADPPAFQRDMQQFRGDHYALHALIADHARHGEKCEGGTDATACNFGRWLASFKTTNPKINQLLQDIRVPHDATHAAVKKAKELVTQGDKEGAVTLIEGEMKQHINRTYELFDAIAREAGPAIQLYEQMNHQALVTNGVSFAASEALLNDLVQINSRIAEDGAHDAQSNAAFLKMATVSATIASLILAALLAFFITRSITKPINRIITGLNDGADQVNDAAAQVSSASQSLAEGASEQASSLEETSSALEQMAAMTRTNAENSKQANELASQTRQAANEGDKSMAQLNEAMNGINDSSDKISKIIKVIEEIAFQTNLLALNAAVEAARAGEHGKGFAVVADEVRNLAQRCAQAARETTSLIEDAVNRAQQGTQVATEVGKSLSAIVGQAAKVSDLISGISQASQEQAQGVDQVNTAVSQMDKVTQQNASGAEQSASAAEQLAAQSQTVKGMVNELMTLVSGHKGIADSTSTTKVKRNTVSTQPPLKNTRTTPTRKGQSPAQVEKSNTKSKSDAEFLALSDNEANLDQF